jgi:hypothetical protein
MSNNSPELKPIMLQNPAITGPILDQLLPQQEPILPNTNPTFTAQQLSLLKGMRDNIQAFNEKMLVINVNMLR